jgi:hypothetical protein
MSPIKRFLLALAAASAIAGCASIGEPQSVGLQVFKDEYDGSTVARQEPVSAGGRAAGDWNALGFEWKSKFPNRVVLVAARAEWFVSTKSRSKSTARRRASRPPANDRPRRPVRRRALVDAAV